MAYKYSKGKTFQGDIYNEDDTQRNTYLDFGQDDYIGLVASGSSVLVVSGSRVGVGTTNPDTTLHIEGSGHGSMWEALRITNTGSSLNDDSAIYFTHYTDDRLQAFIKDDIQSGWDTKLHFGTADDNNTAATKMTLDGDGKLGIGTETPDHELTVVGNVSASVNVSASAFYGDGSHLEGVSTTNPPWTEASSEVYYMGNVGCGVSNPTTRLHVYGDVSSNYLTLIDNDASSAGHALKVTTDGNGSGTYVLDLESQSTTLFRVRGDGRVGIGKVTSLPSACLTVSGSNGDADIAVASKIQHIGDSDTYIEFDDDEDIINLVAGNRSFIKLEEASQDKVIINAGVLDIDLKVGGQNNANLIRTIASNDSVGICTGSPVSTFEVSGSQGANIASLTGTVTIGDTHHTILMGAGNATTTCNLPAASSCTGRIYIFKKIGSDATTCAVVGDNGEDIDDNSDQDLAKRYDTMTIQSDGTQWWILNALHHG